MKTIVALLLTGLFFTACQQTTTVTKSIYNNSSKNIVIHADNPAAIGIEPDVVVEPGSAQILVVLVKDGYYDPSGACSQLPTTVQLSYDSDLPLTRSLIDDGEWELRDYNTYCGFRAHNNLRWDVPLPLTRKI